MTPDSWSDFPHSVISFVLTSNLLFFFCSVVCLWNVTLVTRRSVMSASHGSQLRCVRSHALGMDCCVRMRIKLHQKPFFRVDLSQHVASQDGSREVPTDISLLRLFTPVSVSVVLRPVRNRVLAMVVREEFGVESFQFTGRLQWSHPQELSDDSSATVSLGQTPEQISDECATTAMHTMQVHLQQTTVNAQRRSQKMLSEQSTSKTTGNTANGTWRS